MTQSVDVNALFDRLALLVNGGVSDPDYIPLFNGIDILALDAKVGVDNQASISDATGLYKLFCLLENGVTSNYSQLSSRLLTLEGGVVITNPDTNAAYVDSSSFVITNISPGALAANLLFTDTDPEHEDTTKLTVDIDVGYTFVDFDAGSVIDISGFEMKPWQFRTGEFVTPIPLTTRLMARVSGTDPWITIGTLVVNEQPQPYASTRYKKTFGSESYQYF